MKSYYFIIKCKLYKENVLYFSLRRYFTQINKWDTVCVLHICIAYIVSLLYNRPGWIDSLGFIHFINKSQSASTSGFSL